MKRLTTALVAGTAALAFTVSAQAEPDGAAIYNQACMACHMTGASAAPILGDEAAWAERLEQDLDTLYAHSLDGLGAMPPKGGFVHLSDEEVKAAVDYIVESMQ